MNELRWAELATYATSTEADIIRHMLHEAGIPVLMKGPPTGVFGPGFAGATTHGVRLFVPSELIYDARLILQGDDQEEPNGAA